MRCKRTIEKIKAQEQRNLELNVLGLDRSSEENSAEKTMEAEREFGSKLSK